jgi:positive regulator of sigma E activity
MGFLKAAGLLSTLFVILTLVITLLKQVIGFIGFLTLAIKVLVVIVFVVLFIGVGLLVLRSFNQRRKNNE